MTGAIAAKTNDAEAPITHNDLMEYMQSGCKAPDAWRIGTEHEKFLYHKDTRAPVSYDSEDGRNIRNLLEVLADRHAWTLVKEGDMIVGVTKGKYSINLETGGQIELSGAPLADMHLIARELFTYLDEVRKISADLGIGILGIGLRPKASEKDLPMLQRPRYEALFHDENTANARRWGMLTAAVQCNMDYGSEMDMIKKFRVSLALQPVVTALFANSPFYNGRPSGYLSQRYHFVQSDTHKTQRSVIDAAFQPGFDFKSYVDFAISRPVRFVPRDGKYQLAKGGNFADFMNGKLPGFEGQYATQTDWLAHLSTIHTDVRLRNYIEQRGADGGQSRLLIALPTLWTGLLYDSVALDEAYQLIKTWTVNDLMYLRANVARSGLRTRFRVFNSVRGLALEMVKIAYRGLRNRARKNDYAEDETMYLDRLMYFIASGKTPAEYLLNSYHHRWSQSIDRVIDECSF